MVSIVHYGNLLVKLISQNHRKLWHLVILGLPLPLSPKLRVTLDFILSLESCQVTRRGPFEFYCDTVTMQMITQLYIIPFHRQ